MKKFLTVTILLLLPCSLWAQTLTPQLLYKLVEQNELVKASQSQEAAALAEIKAVQSLHRPQLYAQLAGSWQGEETKMPTYIYTFGDKLESWLKPLFPDLEIPKFVQAGYTVTAFRQAYEAQVGMTWLIYSGGTTQNLIASKKMEAQALTQQTERTKQGVQHGAELCFWGLMKATQYCKLAQDYVALTEKHVEQVKLYLQQGVIAKADLFRAEEALAEAQSKLAQARHGETIAWATMERLTGQPLRGVYTLPQLSDLLPPKINSKMAPTRPEKTALLAGVQAAKWGAKAAAASNNPRLLASASYVNQGRDFWPTERKDWNIALALRWDFFDGGRSQAMEEKALAKAAELQAKQKDMDKQIQLEITTAQADFELALAKEKAYTAALKSAQEALRVAQLKYANGMSNNLDVLDAALKKHSTETDLWSAKFDAYTAAANYRFALGQEQVSAVNQDPLTQFKEEIHHE